MPHTSVFAFIRRSLQNAQAALHDDRPVGELLDGAAGITRRQFVIGTAAAAALASCRTVAPSPSSPEADVIVVGAGIAGLTAAYRLHRAGVNVRVYDGQNRIGGRMLSLRNHFPDGQVVELGGELIDTNHTAIRNLARELAIELDDLATDDPKLAHDIWHFDGVNRTEREVVDAFIPIAARIESDLARMGDGEVTWQTRSAAAADLDRMTLAQWLDGAGVNGWFRKLLDIGFTTEYGLEIDRQSALNLLTMIDTTPEPFRIYGESDERFHVRGGNDRIPTALASLLGDRIELNAMLQRIRRRPDGMLECTFDRGSSSFTAAAPQVIVSIPFTMLRSVAIDVDLPERKRRAIEQLGYGTNAKLMIGFNERTWRARYGSNGSTLTDLPFQLTWETSRLQSGGSGVLTNFTGGLYGSQLGTGPAEARAAETAAHLDKIFPGIAAQRGKEARMHWPTQPFVRGSYACYLPGQWTTMRGVEGESAGNLHFAGEHCSLSSQGFMNGGCETGEHAAEAVLAQMRAGIVPRRHRRPVVA